VRFSHVGKVFKGLARNVRVPGSQPINGHFSTTFLKVLLTSFSHTVVVFLNHRGCVSHWPCNMATVTRDEHWLYAPQGICKDFGYDLVEDKVIKRSLFSALAHLGAFSHPFSTQRAPASTERMKRKLQRSTFNELLTSDLLTSGSSAIIPSSTRRATRIGG